MRSNIYFIRHGESIANEQNLLCGSAWDAELSDWGRLQMSEVASSLESFKIKTILSSPLKRARESAQILQKFIPKAKIETLETLREQSYGAWERTPWSDVKDAFLEKLDPPEGETHADFLQRIKNSLPEINSFPGPILIVAHGGVGVELLDHYGHAKRLIENAEVIQLQQEVIHE